jgi:hypothetical protein
LKVDEKVTVECVIQITKHSQRKPTVEKVLWTKPGRVDDQIGFKTGYT